MRDVWSQSVLAAVFSIVLTTAAGPVMCGEIFVPSGNPQRGRDVFVENGCRVCHAVRGIGGRSGPDLAEVSVYKGVFAIGAGMWSHAPQMRKVAESKGRTLPLLSPDDVRDLLTYLLSIGFVVEAGNSARGRIVFGEKGCAGCHASEGKPSVGPSLERISRVRSPIAVAQDMWNHSAPMAAAMKRLGVEWPLLDEVEMADLIAYLRGRGAPDGLLENMPSDPMVGKALFHSKGCADCHLPKNGLASIGPDLSTSHWYKTSTQLVAVMWNHLPKMTMAAEARGIEIPRFNRNELADIIFYVYVLRSSEKVGNAERGRGIFSSKHCSRCHVKGGSAPDLTNSPALSSPEQVGSAMWNHAPTMQEAIESQGLEWPVLTGEDLADLLAFLLDKSD